MATTQFRVEDELSQQEPSGRRPSWMKGCLIGCLATVVILLLLGTIATIWISRNWRTWFSAGATQAVNQAIDSSELPPEEKNQIKVEVDRFFVDFREGRVSMEQFGKLAQEFAESPLMTTFVAAAIDTKYIKSSGLSDEEKADANITLQRFIRGSIDEKIDKSQIDAAMAHVSTRQGDQWRLKEKVTDEELRAFLAEAKKAADEANVPEQPEEVDPSDEVKRIIDEAMMNPAPPEIEISPPLEIPPADEAPPADEPPPAIEAPPAAEPPPEPKAEN
jgi:hypothetical protein